ncbi:MAG TPA: cyd operon YbgE family protein [Steroidobacteraceae bacterium]|nr:cyd operon YbgE family protein [Steroidobacteraceae bacterium]
MTEDRAAGSGTLARFVSLGLAIGISGILLVFPYLLGSPPAPRIHALLPFLLFGVSSAWVHGLGFVPRRKLWRILFGPIVAWPLILIAGLLIALVRNEA